MGLFKFFKKIIFFTFVLFDYLECVAILFWLIEF